MPLNSESGSLPSDALEARLTLFGFTSTPASLLVTFRPKAERVARSLASVAAAAVLTPLVFMIPPHLEWMLLTVGGGVYWGRKNWVAEFVVASCDALCPRCHSPITIKRGTTLRLPHNVVCYSCHEHPSLELGSAPPVDPARRTEPVITPDRPVGERRPFKIWSPAGSDW